MQSPGCHYVVKTEVRDPRASTFAFLNAKTMYGGKHIAKGDTIFLFASENEGGSGLFARGVVTKVELVPPKKGVAWQTPCVSIWVKRTALSKRPLGRAELRAFRGVNDGSGEAELDFKLYRQATNKLIGIEAKAARLLLRCFVRADARG